MLLSEAVDLCFQTRDTWSDPNSDYPKTCRINANHILRIIGDLPIESINSSHYIDLARVLREESKAPATINIILSTLNTVLNEMKMLGHDLPDVKYKRCRVKNSRPGFFVEEEVERLLEAAKDLPDFGLMYDSILFAVKTGCRQGEMFSLLVDDINFETREILFRDTKNHSDHLIKMHDDLVPVLRRRVEERIGPHLFPWPNRDYLNRAFKKLKSRAGFSDKDERTWHIFRHTTATWLCERGAPLRAVMGVLNHRRVETTLRYSKASFRSVADAIDIL